MKPSPWLSSLIGNYPNPKFFGHDLDLSNDDAKGFASLWLSEGVPFVFHDHPGVYLGARQALASNLGLTFRDISVTGSARIGYSLSPSKFGKVFELENSDIDLFVVSQRLYENVSGQAQKFAFEFLNELVHPRSEREGDLWRDNVTAINKSVVYGYVDAFRVPNFDAYPAIKKINNAAYIFQQNINSWAGRNLVKKCSIRTYESWNHAVKYLGYNLKKSVQYRSKV